MGGLLAFYGTSIGKKVVMAITGLIMVGFVVIHMIGNLKLYLPDNGEHLNHYAEWLKLEMGAPILLPMQGLWIVSHRLAPRPDLAYRGGEPIDPDGVEWPPRRVQAKQSIPGEQRCIWRI